MDDRVGASEGAFWGVEDETEALQRYRTLVNTVDDGIFQLDAEGQFVAVNDVVLETGGLRSRRMFSASASRSSSTRRTPRNWRAKPGDGSKPA